VFFHLIKYFLLFYVKKLLFIKEIILFLNIKLFSAKVQFFI